MHHRSSSDAGSRGGRRPVRSNGFRPSSLLDRCTLCVVAEHRNDSSVVRRQRRGRHPRGFRHHQRIIPGELPEMLKNPDSLAPVTSPLTSADKTVPSTVALKRLASPRNSGYACSFSERHSSAMERPHGDVGIVGPLLHGAKVSPPLGIVLSAERIVHRACRGFRNSRFRLRHWFCGRTRPAAFVRPAASGAAPASPAYSRMDGGSASTHGSRGARAGSSSAENAARRPPWRRRGGAPETLSHRARTS